MSSEQTSPLKLLNGEELEEQIEEIELDVDGLKRELRAIKKELLEINHVKLSDIGLSIDVVRERLQMLSDDVKPLKELKDNVIEIKRLLEKLVPPQS